ncbi:MAG: polymer-forming cytoskeletal protein [Negativicutes bacterium]
MFSRKALKKMFEIFSGSIGGNGRKTIIGPNTSFGGRMVSNEPVHVWGKFEGVIYVEAPIVIETTGCVLGLLRSKTAVVAGILQGNAEIKGKLRLRRTAQVNCEIRADSFDIEPVAEQ